MLPEQEFVAHLFAPLEGPRAAVAHDQLEILWSRLRTEVGIGEPIPGTTLAASFPSRQLPRGDRALAAAQDRRGDRQMILRREHDVLNLSLAWATPAVGGGPWAGLASEAPLSWVEFARWWDQLRSTGIDALLGSAVVFLAKAPFARQRLVDWSSEVVTELPPAFEDAAGWWHTGRPVASSLAIWDVSGSVFTGRRLVMLADRDNDAALGAFTWSDGSTVMPPLCRYLMHAARLRYQASVRGDGTALTELRRQVEERTGRIENAIRDGGDPNYDFARLVGEEAVLENTLADLRLMQRVVAGELENLLASAIEVLPGDKRLGSWLTGQLTDDVGILATTAQRAGRIRELAVAGGLRSAEARPSGATSTVASTDAGPAEPISDARAGSPVAPSALRERTSNGVRPPSKVELRIGFGIDLVGYSSRSTPLQADAQRRILGLVERVLLDLDVRLDETDRQEAGDGMMIMLPTGLELHRVLPCLLHGWHNYLGDDNKLHTDRLRMRMSTSVGPFSRAAIGYAGNTVIEIGRLLDSEALRSALATSAGADFAAFIADRFYQDVVNEGYPGLTAEEFKLRDVAVKAYRRRAWLWMPNAEPGEQVDDAVRLGS